MASYIVRAIVLIPRVPYLRTPWSILIERDFQQHALDQSDMINIEFEMFENML